MKTAYLQVCLGMLFCLSSSFIINSSLKDTKSLQIQQEAYKEHQVAQDKEFKYKDVKICI